MPKITKSVKLVPGESFKLPDGAVLLASSDESALESNCDIPDLEDLQCYVFEIAVGDDDNSDSIFWDASSFRLRGWRYNGVDLLDLDISPVTGLGCYNTGSLKTPLTDSANQHGIFIQNIKIHTVPSDGSDNGCYTFVILESIPSVIAKLEIVAMLASTFADDVSVGARIYIKPQTYADVTGKVAGLPACDVVTSS